MVPAGQSGKLVAKVHTRPTQNGSLKKSIVVALDDPDTKSLNLTLSFTVEAMIEIRPRPQIYVNAVAGSAAEGRILLHRTDGEPLEITEIRFDKEGISLAALPHDPKAAAQPGFKPQEGDIWLTASVGADAAPGQFTGNAWLTTNHPKMKEMEIPVTVRLRPVMEVRPERLQLWIQEGAGAQQGTLFRMVHNREEGFEVVGIDVEDEGLVVATLLDKGESRAHSIRVSPTEAITAEDVVTPRATQIIIRTSLEDFPEVVVPVTLAGRRPISRPLRPQQPEKRVVPMPLPTGTPNYG